MRTSPFLALALNVLIISSLLAQTAPQSQSPRSVSGDDEVVRITTNLVQVDAVVTDKDGKILKL